LAQIAEMKIESHKSWPTNELFHRGGRTGPITYHPIRDPKPIEKGGKYHAKRKTKTIKNGKELECTPPPEKLSAEELSDKEALESDKATHNEHPGPQELVEMFGGVKMQHDLQLK